MDVLSYFRDEMETVGRQWLDLVPSFGKDGALWRPGETLNHALWLTGHMAWAEDYLVLEVPKGAAVRRKDWDALFDHTSEKLPADQYPSFDEVVSEYRRVHGDVLKRLAALTPGDLARASASGQRWFPTAAHAISHQVTHGHYHLGQFVLLEKLWSERRPK